MTNAQIIDTLAKKLIKQIAFRMAEMGESYDQAKAVAMSSSVAGPAVWAVVDAHF